MEIAIYGQRFDGILTQLDALMASPDLKDQHLSKEINDKLAAYRERGVLSVAFVGEYSAGKTSLISALTGRRDLKISADIATDQCKHYQWHAVHLVDTPGLWTERKDHDQTAMKAIAEADLIVYCLTYSLFDTTTLANFNELAFERNFQQKMLLLVNKMSAEAGDVETRIEHYKSSLAASLVPYQLRQFPVLFCDARDEIDGVDESDDELRALSRFDLLTEALDKFCRDKGELAKLDTPIRMVLDTLDQASTSCQRAEGKDDQYLYLSNQITGAVSRGRRGLRAAMDAEVVALAGKVARMGIEFADRLGSDPALEGDLKLADTTIQAHCDESAKRIQMLADGAIDALQKDFQRTFESPIMKDYMASAEQSPGTGVGGPSNIGASMQKSAAALKRLGDVAGVSSVKGFVSATEASKTLIADGIRTVGKWVGHSFKPWQAANWAKNVINAAPYIGVALSVLAVASDVVSEVEAVNNEATLARAKRDLINGIANTAGDIRLNMQGSCAEIVNGIYGQLEDQLAAMKLEYETELGQHNEFIQQVCELRSACTSLLKDIAA